MAARKTVELDDSLDGMAVQVLVRSLDGPPSLIDVLDIYDYETKRVLMKNIPYTNIQHTSTLQG